MDAGSRSRNPLQEVSSKVVYIPPMAATGVPFKNPLSRQPSGGDRFIPDRSSMDFDVAHYLLTQSRKEKENPATGSPAKEAYRRMLDDALMPNRSRILAFRSKPQVRAEGLVTDVASDNIAATQQSKPGRQRRYIPQSAERTLDAPDIIDDYYLNLLGLGPVMEDNGKFILFIDEIHLVLGAGRTEGSIDATNLLKPMLARGQLRCIGATTLEEYRKYVEKDTAFERRFQQVYVAEPSMPDTISILHGLKEKYEGAPWSQNSGPGVSYGGAAV